MRVSVCVCKREREDLRYIPSQVSWLFQSDTPAPMPAQVEVKVLPPVELYPSAHVTVTASPVVPVWADTSLLAMVRVGQATAVHYTYTHTHTAKEHNNIYFLSKRTAET